MKKRFTFTLKFVAFQFPTNKTVKTPLHVGGHAWRHWKDAIVSIGDCKTIINFRCMPWTQKISNH